MSTKHTASQSQNAHHGTLSHFHGNVRSRRILITLAVLATLGVMTIAGFQLLVFATYQDTEGNRSEALSALLQKTTASTGAQKTNATAASHVQDDTIQAVFLSNGQVYFGRITTLASDLVILNDVFYPKAQKTEQATTNEDASADTITEAGGVALRKLGKNEFHEPQDTLYIQPANMLYWENLEKDSRVTKGILEYEAKQAASSNVKTNPATNTTDVSKKGEASDPAAATNTTSTSEEDPNAIE